MANEGVELTAAKTMQKPRPPTPPITRAAPAGTKKSRPPPSRSSSSANSAAKSGKASRGTKKNSSRSKQTAKNSGSKQTAKKRARRRAMTPEELAAKKRKSIIGSVSTAVILIGCGFAIWYFALGAPTTVGELKDGVGNAINNTKTKIDAIGDVLDNLDGLDWGGFFREDPWQGNTTVTMWNEKYIKRDRGGLQLTVVNSLSADWQNEFETAVADWSESDSLTLSVEVLPVDDAWDNDRKCARQTGKLVVCNGNFGETGWVGINLNEVQTTGRIISSVAQMNEYYLRNANFYHRRFTMCHEIGHGKCFDVLQVFLMFFKFF